MSKRSSYLLFGAAFIAVLGVPAVFFSAAVTQLDEEPFLVEASEVPREPSFRVFIAEDDVLKVDDRKLTLVEFQGFLKQLPVPGKDASALIYADQDITAEYVVKVQSFTEEAGYNARVGVVRLEKK